jgi:hypothetical protein
MEEHAHTGGTADGVGGCSSVRAAQSCPQPPPPPLQLPPPLLPRRPHHHHRHLQSSRRLPSATADRCASQAAACRRATPPAHHHHHPATGRQSRAARWRPLRLRHPGCWPRPARRLRRCRPKPTASARPQRRPCLLQRSVAGCCCCSLHWRLGQSPSWRAAVAGGLLLLSLPPRRLRGCLATRARRRRRRWRRLLLLLPLPPPLHGCCYRPRRCRRPRAGRGRPWVWLFRLFGSREKQRSDRGARGQQLSPRARLVCAFGGCLVTKVKESSVYACVRKSCL